MSVLLSTIVPPHAPDHPSKLKSLIATYRRDKAVPPIVVVEFGDLGMALCGSHRIAAMRAVFEDTDICELVAYAIVVDGSELWELIEAAGDRDALEALGELHNGQTSDYSDTIALLLPYLPEEAEAPLMGQ